jgi:AraC-like DNA-binding protein
MSSLEISSLKNSYEGKSTFQSKEKGYEIDLFSDEWVLGYKKNLYLRWMNALNSDIFLDLRLAIAHAAKHYAFRSLSSFVSTLKRFCEYLEPAKFEAWWLTLTSYKKSVRDALFALCKRSQNEYRSNILTPLYNIVKDESLGRNVISKSILDETIGAYSEIERDNLLEAVRIETLNALDNKNTTQKTFTHLRSIIACQLMVAIVRRPCQLTILKWCDILPVGQVFKSHKESNRNWEPLTQHYFSDVGQLHIRTFKGKDGQFRGSAESRSHRLEPDLSELLLQYYLVYEARLCTSLSQNNIVLSGNEKKELMQRLPLLPDQSLFTAEFETKESLFISVSDTSEAFHVSSDALTTNIDRLFNKKLDIKSDRLAHKPLTFKNNRWRHTQLTIAARLGLSPAQIAAITGVTLDAILPYLDLKAPERVKIDEAYAGNSIIQRFDSVSSKHLQQHPDFIVKSPFDEEMGHKLNPANCASCQSKGSAPMGCYPCDNFRPLESANHQQYLEKAERKLAINSQSAHPATVKKLQTIVLYIKVTIALCEERKTLKLEGTQQ